MILRRETIVALRARHTAFRIAIDLLYPMQKPPQPPPLPAPPWVESEFRTVLDAQQMEELKRRAAALEVRQNRRLAVLVLFVLALYMGLMIFAVTKQTTDGREASPSAPSPATQPATTAPGAPLPMQRP